jgi:DNA-binding PadR family transcriptional regulator
MKLRRSPQTNQVLRHLLSARQEWRHGYAMSRDTGLKSGTLYPILIRLAEIKLLETRWEETKDGRPPRHLYRLTLKGVEVAQSCSVEPQSFTAGEAVLGV